MGLFRKAVKQDARLRLAIAGPSGSGKTYSALAIATELGKKIAFVDTEHGSASKYADLFDFDVAEMHAPYNPNKYVRTIHDAAEAGYDVVILDSLSHAWNGEGGVLQMVEDAATRLKGNSYAGWKDVTPLHNAMIEAMLGADVHLIATMRSKQEYVQERNDKGYTSIRKVGMAPIQRDGMEYEFDVFLDMNIDNKGIVAKSRCPELSGQVIDKPGKQVATILRKWLQGQPPAAERKEQEQKAVVPPVTAVTTPMSLTVDLNNKSDALDLEIVQSWKSSDAAKAWAIRIGAASFMEDAAALWLASTKEFGGYTKDKHDQIGLHFIDACYVKASTAVLA